MKRNSTFTSFLVLVITVLLFTITSILMSSCSGIRYTYYNKQKVPYTAAEETRIAKAIPAKPFLTQSENEVKEKISQSHDKNDNHKNEMQNAEQDKTASPATLQQIFNGMNIAKYIPKQYKSLQSENSTNDDQRTLLIVVLVVLILVVISLLGQDLLWLLFLALLILIIYFLVKYLGIFN